MNKKLNKSLRLLLTISLWIVLIVACLSVYNLYEYNKLHPQNKYEWNTILESPPEEFVIKNEMMHRARNTILLGVLLAMLWEVLLYFDDPEKHFTTYWYRKLKPLLKKIEDE